MTHTEKKGSRIAESAEENLVEPHRLGRRESEPHSYGVTYLYNVLTTNFPDSSTLWDLHHYFYHDGEELDLQFDISFFQGTVFKEFLPSFRSSERNGLKPTLVINILSKSTWRKDVLDHVEMCRMLKIPYYAVYTPYNISPKILPAPLLRIYILQSDGSYIYKELVSLTYCPRSFEQNPGALLDISDSLPFRFGLEEIDRLYSGGKPVYRAVLVDRKSSQKLLTAVEFAQINIDAEKKRADAEKERADAEKSRADAEKSRADSLQKELDDLKLTK